MKKLIWSLAIISVFAASLLFAVDRQERRELMQGLGDELRAYAEENIHPQMLDWKAQIDETISTEDLEKLNELRAEASKFMDEMKDKRQDMRGMNKGRMNKGKKGEMKNKSNPMKDKMRAGKEKFHDELEAIISNYPDYFSDLFDEVEDKQDEWKEDMKEIRDNWFEENESELDDMPNKGKMKGKMRAHRFDNKFQNPEHILLWNGVPPRHPKMDSEMNGDSLEAYNSPNPFNESTTINYNIEKTGIYTIEVINTTGNKIETLHSGNLNEGNHSFNFTAKNLEPGVYFYKISGEGFEQTNKMIISK